MAEHLWRSAVAPERVWDCPDGEACWGVPPDCPHNGRWLLQFVEGDTAPVAAGALLIEDNSAFTESLVASLHDWKVPRVAVLAMIEYARDYALRAAVGEQEGRET